MVFVRVPVAVLVAVGFRFVVRKFRAAEFCGLLEIFRAVGVVVGIADHPFVQQRVALVDTGGGAGLVFLGGGPGVVVEVIE